MEGRGGEGRGGEEETMTTTTMENFWMGLCTSHGHGYFDTETVLHFDIA